MMGETSKSVTLFNIKKKNFARIKIVEANKSVLFELFRTLMEYPAKKAMAEAHRLYKDGGIIEFDSYSMAIIFFEALILRPGTDCKLYIKEIGYCPTGGTYMSSPPEIMPLP